jgi:hypothetical protein
VRTEKVSYIRSFDYVMLLSALALVAFGIVLIYSGSLANYASPTDVIEHPVARQVAFAVIGLIAMFTISRIDYRLLGYTTIFLYAGALAALTFVLVAGQAIYGSRRWIELAVRWPARRFARLVMAFDDAVDSPGDVNKTGSGIREAARGFLHTFADGLTVLMLLVMTAGTSGIAVADIPPHTLVADVTAHGRPVTHDAPVPSDPRPVRGVAVLPLPTLHPTPSVLVIRSNVSEDISLVGTTRSTRNPSEAARLYFSMSRKRPPIEPCACLVNTPPSTSNATLSTIQA